MPSETSTVQRKQATKSAVEVPSKQQQQSHSRPTSQSTEEWLKELDDLEAQSKGSSGDASKSMSPAQVNYRQLSSRLKEGMDHEDILDALERGEL